MIKEYVIEKIFSDEGIKFLRDDMGICVDDLNEKIFSDASEEIAFFKELIDYIITLKPPYDYYESSSLADKGNIHFINAELGKFFSKYNIDKVSKANFIYDNIRHAYTHYSVGGILAVYKERSAEAWYPKVIIRSNIGDRKDIELLDDEVVIYRGTSKEEYNSNVFGQSWTLDKGIAKQFAFEHYENQPKFENTTRVVLKANIDKQHIFYYKKDDIEKEVIVNSNKLIPNTIEVIDEAELS